jgi:hypothetical protein
MPQLVDDVVLDILHTAYRPELHLPDYRILSRFSLVSKFWAVEAQKRLFGEGKLRPRVGSMTAFSFRFIELTACMLSVQYGYPLHDESRCFSQSFETGLCVARS